MRWTTKNRLLHLNDDVWTLSIDSFTLHKGEKDIYTATKKIRPNRKVTHKSLKEQYNWCNFKEEKKKNVWNLQA